MADQVWKRRLQKTLFTSVLILENYHKKIKGKNPEEMMCQLIFLKICQQQETQWHKNSLSYIYLLGMSNDIVKFIFKVSQYPFIASLCSYVYFNFFKTKHDFARLIFSVYKFQEMGTKSLFLSFQNSFSASYFPISQEQLDQNSSLTPLLNNIWNL